MKRFILIIASALTLLVVSCTKDSAGVTRITYYPTITLQGDDPYIMKVGDTFTDPGFIAEMNGEDISSSVAVTSTVNNAQVGIYSVKYSTKNADGIEASASRAVYVTNPAGTVENVYSSACGWDAPTAYSGFPILVSTYSPGVYLIEDLCGGFYCYGRYPGYEPSYDFHAEGLFSVDASGNLTLLGAGDWYFRTSFDYTAFSGTFDSTTGVIDIDFDGMIVKLTPFI